VTIEVLIAAILSLQPRLSAKVAERHARTVLEVTGDEDDAAALIVTAHREARFRTNCVIGIGGRGPYGLGVGYSHWACGPMKIAALMSLQALYDKGWAFSERRGFRGYLGAKVDSWPEVGVRMRLWEATRQRIKCACSI
jgi:hypothetical protein